MNVLNLDYMVLASIVFTSVVQSIFGVGVLLFGTPILLLLGYDYPVILSTLLPISITISLTQIVRDFRQIDFRFMRGILIYTVPFIVGFLLIALHSTKQLGMLIALILLLFALKNVYRPLDKTLAKLARFEITWLAFTGIIHGLTNLGGSLLTILVQQRGYPKDKARATIATAYVLFASFQLATLLIAGSFAHNTALGSAGYAFVGICVYLATNEWLFKRLNAQTYATAFSGFLFCSSVLVGLKTIL